MRIHRKTVAVILATLACASVLLVVFLNAIIDRNRQRIREEVEKSLGRSFSFEELRLSLWGGMGLLATQLRVAEDPRFAATPLIQTKELKIQLRWLPLLVGNIAIKKFVLDEPEIQIIRNEEGTLNLSALASAERKIKESGKEIRKAPEAKKRPAWSALPSAIHVTNGRIDYIDRSFKEPVEVRIRNVKMDLRGLDLSGNIGVKFSASLFDGQGQNLSVEGVMGPWQGQREWTQHPVDLQFALDSLLLRQLSRAVPFLREPLSGYLGITGPLMVQAKLLGTFERPRISDLTITGAAFGAAEKNAAVTGELDFSKSNSWREGEIKGKIAVDPVSLEYLRKIPFLRQILPASLSSEGPLSVASELQGSLENLQIHARIKAGESEILLGDWLKKTKGVPAEMEVTARRQKDRLVFEDSSLTIHNMKLKFSGLLSESPERRVMLQLQSNDIDLAGWERLLVPLSAYSIRGVLRGDLVLKKKLAVQDGGLEIQGALTLDGIQGKNKKSNRGFEKMTAKVLFLGTEARMDPFSFRLGSSNLSVEAMLPDLSRPTVRYHARAPLLNLPDLTGDAVYKRDEMRNLLSSGELQITDGRTILRGNISSSEGTLQDIPYRNLRGEVSWSPSGVSFKNVSVQAISGTFRGSGSWETGTDDQRRVVLDARIEAMDLKALLSQKFPNFRDHMEGQLNFNAKLLGESKNSSNLQEGLQGEGVAQIRNGSLKNFNLVERVLSKVSGLPGISSLVSSRLPARYSPVFQRQDTPFDTLAATFSIKQGRIYSDDVYLATPDYSITAEGWVGFDKTMKWQATLVMSSQFTQELMREHRNVRYMVDRQGRLSVPFRLEGALPSIQVKPDLQGLLGAIQRGLAQRGIDRALREEKDEKRRERRDWFQKGLEQLFGK